MLKMMEKGLFVKTLVFLLTHWHPASFEKMALLSSKWPFLTV